MQYEIKNIRGLSTRQNDIYQNEFNCIDCDNVHLNKSGKLVKLDDLYRRSIIPEAANTVDAYYIKSRDELLVVTTDRFLSILNASEEFGSIVVKTVKLLALTGLEYTAGMNLSFAEMNDNLYIADPSGYNFVQKYDGQTVTRAGVWTPSIDDKNAAGTDYFMRSFIGIKDANGLETYGDYIQSSVYFSGGFSIGVTQAQINDSPDRDVLGLKLTTPFLDVTNGFPTSGLDFTFSVSVNTGDHNLSEGDVLYADFLITGGSGYGYEEKKMTVLSIISFTTTDTILITVDGSSEFGYVTSARFFNAISNCRTYFAVSTDETFGYKVNSNIVAVASDSSLTINPNMGNFMWYSPNKTDELTYSLDLSIFALDLEDIYDTTILKGDMPLLKTITSFQNQMVGVSGDFEISWSDLGLGSTCETFAPFDKEIFNKSDEGKIISVFGGDSYVSVFKESDIYHVQGILYGKSYRSVKDTSSGIGCVSQKSIVKFNGGCLFLSSKGVYFSNGQLSKEITDHIEDLMEAIPNKDTVKAYPFYDDEKILFCCDDYSYEFDYYKNEWFRHTLYKRNVFFPNKNDNTLMELDGEDLKKSDSTLTKLHSANYRTSWIVLDQPYNEKKFNYMVLMSTANKSFSTKISMYYNWSTSFSDSESKEFSSSIFLNKYGFGTKKANSASFNIVSEIGEDFDINGILIDYEQYQGKVRG